MLREAMAAYRVESLAQGTPAELEAAVRAFSEAEPSPLRAEPDRFWIAWGHDHDFGSFRVRGRMGTRHLWLLARFLDELGLPLEAIRGRRVLDVGCWTGGLSLLLAALGAEVVAIDPFRRHLEAAEVLKKAFAVDALAFRPVSVYDVDADDLGGPFDAVFFCGVLYHHTDPYVALRRLFHVLRPGGWLCVETMSTHRPGPVCEYRGPMPKDGRPFASSNWFLPSPLALERMLEDARYDAIRVGNGVRDGVVTDARDPLGDARCLAVARRLSDRPAPIYGPSVPVG
jgi:SAM-dependent methyltransferase